MSQFPSASVAGFAADDAQETLTPERIEMVLADFRSWLYELAAAEAPPSSVPAEAAPPDLHTLLGQFVALRHEVNLQTKAARGQQEQNAETLRHLSQALEAVQSTPHEEDDEALRPLLKTLVDLADALGLARRELQRSRQVIEAALAEQQTSLPPPVVGEEPYSSEGWAGFLHHLIEKLFERKKSRRRKSSSPPPPKAPETAGRIRHMLDALITGYTMSLQRVERALQQHGLEAIPCAGRPFDPEQMEAVEVVVDSGRPSGEVVDVARPGYLWEGRIFRYAQVRVAK